MSSISRRVFATTFAAAAGSAGLGAQTPAGDEGLKSELLIDLALDTQPANNVGSPGVNRVIVPVSGGTFDGPKLKGTVVGPGGDWIVRRPDGSSVLDVRIILQTDDNQKIYMTYRGISYTPQGGAQVLAHRAGVRDRRREVRVAEQHRLGRCASRDARQGRVPHFSNPVGHRAGVFHRSTR